MNLGWMKEMGKSRVETDTVEEEKIKVRRADLRS